MLVYGIVFLPFLAAAAAYPLGIRRERLRDMLVPCFAACIFGLCLLLFGHKGQGFVLPGVLSMGLSFTVDGFRTVYALITSFMWLMTSLFSREYFAHEREGLSRYYVFWLMTLGATEGVMLSADLMTTFVFFEILSFTSFTWVLHEQTREAIRAGYTYLFIAVIGGLLLLMGLLLLYSATGTLTYAELPAAMERVTAHTPSGISPAGAAFPTALANASAVAANAPAALSGRLLAAGILILLGFGAKAGMYPLHVWLPKAHPVAPSPGSAILSGVLTKVGIFGILMTTLEAFPRHPVLGATIYVLGLVTMFLGALLALFSVNLKRTLACSSMSQVGFILTGLGSFVLQGALQAGEAAKTADLSGTLGVLTQVSGEGQVLASSGLMLHMVNHSLLKLALFMIAGVVVMNLHKLDLNEIRGFGRKKPLLKLAFALGGLGISGVPFFNGYISKTMLHEGIVMLLEGAWESLSHGSFLVGALSASEWVFLVSGGLTFAYMLKLFLCIFVEKNQDPALQAAYDSDKPLVTHSPASTGKLSVGGSRASAKSSTAGTPAAAASSTAGTPAAAASSTAAVAATADPATVTVAAVPGSSAAAPRRTYMNGLSAFAILGSAVFMVILGQPAVMNRLAAFMTGNHEILEFQAFTLGNLKGGFISLGIGAAVYLLLVRGLLMSSRFSKERAGTEDGTLAKGQARGMDHTEDRLLAKGQARVMDLAQSGGSGEQSEKKRRGDGSILARMLHLGGAYRDCWPKWLDIEEQVYRPLLTKILPGLFGAIVRIPAENVVSGFLCRKILAFGKAFAKLFGENLLLGPICRGTLFLGTFVGRCLSTGTDAFFALLRRTALRERKVRTAEEYRPGRVRVAIRVTQDALRPLSMNFSFALMMTCIGIVVFLITLLVSLLG